MQINIGSDATHLYGLAVGLLVYGEALTFFVALVNKPLTICRGCRDLPTGVDSHYLDAQPENCFELGGFDSPAGAVPLELRLLW